MMMMMMIGDDYCTGLYTHIHALTSVTLFQLILDL